MSAQSKVHSAIYPGYSCAFAYIIHCKSAHKRNKIQQQITQCWDHHQTLTDKDIPQLRNKWRSKYAALFGSIPLELSLFREVNHEINLVDPDKRIHYRLPKCPEHYCSDLSAKIQRYTTAEWWIPVTAR